MLAMKTLLGAGWLVSSRFLGRGIDFVTLLVFARMLTPADFGLVAMALTLVLIVDTVLEVPVVQALVRLENIETEQLDTGFTLAVIRSSVIALVLLAGAWPFAAFNGEPALSPVICTLALGPVARGFASPAMVFAMRELGFRQTFIMEVVGKIVAFAAAMATLLLGGSYWALVANFTAVSVAAVAASYVLAPYRPRLSLARLRDFAGFFGWFSSAQLVAALNWQFDRLLIGAVKGKESLGPYTVANDMAVLPTQSLIGPALQPVMAAFARISNDRERLRFAFLKAARFAMLIAVPASLGIALTADLVVALLLGPKWTEAAPLLQLLALAVMPIPYFQTLYSLSLAIDRPYIIFRMNLCDLSLRLILISAAFHSFGVLGVGYGRVLLSGLMFVVYLFQLRALVGIGLMAQLANIWKVAVAAAVMAGGVLALRHHLAPLGLPGFVEIAVVAAAGAGLYVTTLLGLGMRLLLGGGRLELADRW